MSDDTILENVTKRGPGRPSKADRDAMDIAAARARAAAQPKNALAPESDRDAIQASVSVSAEPEAFELYGAMPAGKLKAMELKRHYRPQGAFEIVGHTRPEVKKKNTAGVMEVVSPAKFIDGEMNPPPVPGVVHTHKIWAGTVIRVPVDEAKAMRVAGIAEASLEDD
jgi:hypothetical protein